MKPCHRWTLFAAAVSCIAAGSFVASVAFWWVRDPLARCCVFAGGILILGVGMALIAGAGSED